MKAISLHQPHASLLVTRQPCDCVFDGDDFEDPLGAHHPLCNTRQMVKRFETRSWPCPPALIGQPISIHATKRKPDVRGCQEQWIGEFSVGEATDGGFGLTNYENLATNQSTWINLPLGAIVGSGRITASYRVLTVTDDSVEPDHFVEIDRDGASPMLMLWGPSGFATDISDQLPYGDWTPGRYAWVVEDAAPTTERCPWCWGSGLVAAPMCGDPDCCCTERDCPICHGVGRCDPIPARGHPRVWNWQP